MDRLPVPAWIRRKRDGSALARAEIDSLIAAYARGLVPDYQMAALAMAIFFRGLDDDETSALTLAMRDSGDVVARGAYGRVAIDKHSTGGVGDKLSIALAPIVASCGVAVPMICGRGLGHTGGTVDKLEAIPGYRTQLPRDEFVAIVRRVGAAMAGQSDALAPADKKLYALRDVTATVESIPLITASILSKKLAEGLDGLVLDVKTGRGAFMHTEAEAHALADSLVRVGRAAGVPVVAVLTRMDEPLGRTIGNALELIEAIEIVRGTASPMLMDLTLSLAAEMVALGGVASAADARTLVTRVVRDGSALAKLGDLIEAHGGDPRVLDDPTNRLPRAPHVIELCTPEAGTIRDIDALEMGLVAMDLGAGRRAIDDRVDPAVGLEILVELGSSVARDEPVVRVHAASAEAAEQVRARILGAIEVGDPATERTSIIDVVR
jgi:pyrimidine-nucleoside phosphorylase